MALLLTVGRRPTLLLAATALVALAGCSREPAGAESARGGNATVGAAPASATASTPMPVSPQGLTNSSTAAQSQDLTNSTSARGNTNLPQPPSADNPASGPGVAGTGSPAPTPNQTTSSQTLGTNPGAASSTAPSGTTGNSGTKSGGGKL
jgi:hypothetical protein